ncbi:MAG: carbamoyltransferase HypF [Gammaproteobacteria bacterium]|nr:carbamoyltransferase HypF [Gammaproteobacteria bacterium]
MISIEIRVSGRVQGVGFRPTVWRLATALQLNGSVCNDGQGVLIQLEGERKRLDLFQQQLTEQCPPLARIDQLQSRPLHTEIDRGFVILPSQQHTIQTGVVADAATCEACLQELNNPQEARFQYPFLNCTHCGPRFSIIKAIPYDRQQTSMACFPLCQRCQAEYDTPADRRFHAQPIACPDCGPQLSYLNSSGEPQAEQHHALLRTAAELRAGNIIAIKGIGGFHLACDAHNKQSIERLRQRKGRPDKPLAMMAKNTQQVEQYCHLNAAERQSLQSSAAPILLLRPRQLNALPDNLAPQQRLWGVMLPHSPLHHLLMAKLTQPIVLTSANRSGEPQCIDNESALMQLAPLAEGFLLHNRHIENRIDDSVGRFMAGKVRLLRRGRGYAPEQLKLPAGFEHSPPLLAFGGELKNTFCLLQSGSATLSQHIGDLESLHHYDDYQHHLQLYQQLFAHQPSQLIIDQHPEYLSSKLGRDWAEQQQLPLIEVQHHHAHIAACMGEHHLPRQHPPLLGIVFDGLGYAADGQLWGGEFLRANYRQATRLAHLKTMPLLGGAQAMREPWRNLFAQLHAVGWAEINTQFADLSALQELNKKPLATLQRMIEQQLNSPNASSMGRLFDAVAAALGLAPTQCSYEGQAASALEAAITSDEKPRNHAYPFAIQTDQALWQLDPTPLWQPLLKELQQGVPVGVVAYRFHQGLANSVVKMATKLAKKETLKQVVLSGGVFQNRTLLESVTEGLQQNGLTVFSHQMLPANDGGLAFGQALIGAAQQRGE